MNSGQDYLTRKEVTELLGIRPQTLYSYVSRGWIRSAARPDTKLKLYFREDVERALERIRAHRGHGAVAASAMRWGDPIIRSAITEITPAGPRYRGHLAVELAGHTHGGRGFENVAELLWTGIRYEEPMVWELERPRLDMPRLMRETGMNHSPDQLLQMMALATLALGMSRGVAAERIKQGTAIPAARQLIRLLAGCFGFLARSPAYTPVDNARESISMNLARACGIAPGEEALAALNAALILSADHELSPSTFNARVAASTGADLHACVASALCTHSGMLHGRVCDRAEDLLAGAASTRELRQRMDTIHRSGTRLPGFDHPLYPRGDPRAAFLIEQARLVRRPHRSATLAFKFLEEAERLGAKPSIEVSLVVLAHALGLPARSAGGLFALGRCAGWVAHIMEQRLLGFVLRPRALFALDEVRASGE